MNYHALKWKNCLNLAEFDEKSTFGEEQQAFRPGLKPIDNVYRFARVWPFSFAVYFSIYPSSYLVTCE